MDLNDFIDAHMARPWAPGSVDCLLVLADWAMVRGYPDAAAHLRGTYHNEDGFRAIVERAGGAVPLVQDCSDRIGLTRADAPEYGFIAVVGSRRDIHRQWGGIWDGESWRVRFVNDFALVKAHPLAIWKL